MLTILNLSVNLAAVCIFCASAAIAFKNRKFKGATEFIIMILAAITWTLGSMLEMQTIYMGQKIFWHNFSTIASGFVPVIVYCFTVSFTDTENRFFKKMRIAIIIFYVAMVVIILTDSKYHFLTDSFQMRDIPDIGFRDIPDIGLRDMLGQGTLQTNYTTLGKCYVIYNEFLIGTSIFILFNFYVRAGKLFKKQILYVSSGILLIAVMAWWGMIKQSSYFGQISGSLIFVLSSIFILIGMFRNQLFPITAFARDKIVDIIDQGVIVSSYNGKIVDVNTAAVSILRVIGNPDSRSENTLKITGECAETIREKYPEWQKYIIEMKKGQFEIKSHHGVNAKYYSVSVYPIESQHERVGAISILSDITHNKKKIVALRAKAEIDGLTEIFNRTTFVEYVEKSVGQSDDCSEHLWMIFLDIDCFKKINDTHGHAAGDYVLKELAGIVRKSIRKNDIFGRLGGEEFGIFKIVDISSYSYSFCERIRKSVESHAFVFENNNIDVTISIGCACLPIANFTNVEMLIKRADGLMYRAKKNGRNRTEIMEFYDPENSD